MSLDQLNGASADEVAGLLRQCCTCEAWIERVVQQRPFASAQELQRTADRAWIDLAEGDYLQAFEGHPKIGDINSLQAKYANTKALAAGEQSAVDNAGEDVIAALAQGNSEYEQKFGFIFIVCATGKSAGEMLALLQARLPNDRELELLNAAEEQRKIFQIRLEKLL